MGKRLHAEFFARRSADGHPVEGCNYLLALDMEMDPIPGYEIASWEHGYGDFAMKPDLATLRRIPWLEATALVLCDVLWHDGSPVQPSPRQVLKAQMERAAALGFTPMTGSELEFYLLRETYEEAWAQRYEDLTPSVPYILDYHILATTYDEDLHPPDPQRDARRRHQGRDLEGRGLAGPARDQLPLRRRADDGRQPRDLQERREGDRAPRTAARSRSWRSRSSRGSGTRATSTRRSSATASLRSATTPTLFDRFLAGQIACFKELAIFLAPTINSYKRYAAGSWAPTTLAWGHDNRTCGFRLVGHGAVAARRDADPRRRRQPVPRVRGDDRRRPARDRERARAAAGARGERLRVGRGALPVDRCARRSLALELGTMARAAFGDQVVDHYLNYAHTEQALFDKVVTDWERMRLFERG